MVPRNVRLSSAAARRGLFFALACLAAVASAAEVAPPKDDFSRLVQLAPFVVKGQQLAVSIHARSGGDRRYAEGFAEDVMKVVYEAVTDRPGKGLVIVGKKGEPHPIVFFRQFLALAEAGKLDPAIAARGPELFSMLNHWQHEVGEGNAADKAGGGEVDMEFDQIVTALPLPLEGIGAKLYQLAWAEKFDEAKVEARLRALRAADLERDLFAHFDWVFYLPPKGAFDRVLDEIVAAEMKEEEAGLLARAAVKTVMLVVKPKIRAAMEVMRRGVMLSTVAQARGGCGKDEASALMAAYVESQIDEDGNRPAKGSDHERAVQAVREAKRKVEERPAERAAEADSTAGTS